MNIERFSTARSAINTSINRDMPVHATLPPEEEIELAIMAEDSTDDPDKGAIVYWGHDDLGERWEIWNHYWTASEFRVSRKKANGPAVGMVFA